MHHSIWRTKMLKIFFAVGVVTLLTITSGMAQSAAMKACAGDVKSLCAGVQPGDGRVRACIKSHFSDVSAPCQAGLVKAAAISKACSADVKKICADVKPGGGRIEACMKSHLSEVSDPCKDAVSQATAGKS
jgi:Cysteine rich repeat